MKRLNTATRKTLKSLWQLLPVLAGVLLLAGMVVEIIPLLVRQGILGHGLWQDTILANIIGSVSTGQPIVSYVLAGELQTAGIGLLPVTVFIISWVTVGVISLPAEAVTLGWRFALSRNLIAFIMALLIGWLTVVTLNAF
ncbi:MAG TPA: hypothetical protein ENJ11_09930 [Gammaproteobacteria bacterium]|nr:hypothetical protein [Gammaproteobacteria bacterium]